MPSLEFRITTKVNNTESRQKYAKDIDRMRTTIKKRIKRLENNDLTDSPAYKSYMENADTIAFSVRGKTTQELQSEYWKLKHLVDLKTGTVKGANEVIKKMADTFEIKYNTLSELKEYYRTFFQLKDRIENYLSSIGDTARTMDYRKIMNDTAEIIKQTQADLTQAGLDIEDYLDTATRRFAEEYLGEFGNEF